MKQYDVIVIGGGAAGMSCANSLSVNKKVLLIEREDSVGGVLNQCIHSGFGIEFYNENLTGPAFAQRLKVELINSNCEISLKSHVIDVNEDRIVSYVNEDGYIEAQAKLIVFAIGSMERSPGAINLPGKRLNGIHSAGSAQKFINLYGNLVGKRVFILGSGDIGLIMARRMSLEGAQVLGVAELMPYSNGLARNVAQCLEDFDIPLYLSHTVSDCIGTDNLEKIRIQEVDQQFNFIAGTEKEFVVDTLLLAVGLIPLTTFYQNLAIKINPKTKSAIVDSNYETTAKNFYAIGNCLHVHDIVDYAAKEGEICAHACLKKLDEINSLETLNISILPGPGIVYTVPNMINYNFSLPTVEIFFRVNSIYKNVMLSILFDGQVYRTIKKDILLPAEMSSIKLKHKSLTNVNEIKIIIEEA